MSTTQAFVGTGASQTVSHTFGAGPNYATYFTLGGPEEWATLTHFDCHGLGLTGDTPSLTASAALINIVLSSNAFTGYTASTIAATCVYFTASNNLLTEAAVDQILADFATGIAGRPAVGQIILNGTGNAAPSAAGIASRNAILAAKPGWTVTVNS